MAYTYFMRLYRIRLSQNGIVCIINVCPLPALWYIYFRIYTPTNNSSIMCASCYDGDIDKQL